MAKKAVVAPVDPSVLEGSLPASTDLPEATVEVLPEELPEPLPEELPIPAEANPADLSDEVAPETQRTLRYALSDNSWMLVGGHHLPPGTEIGVDLIGEESLQAHLASGLLVLLP